MIEAVVSPQASPAAFFAAPPATPSALLAARTGVLADPTNADKFRAAVAEARSANNADMAASGSWVAGQYTHALKFVQGDAELAAFIRGSSLIELSQPVHAMEALKDHVGSSDPVMAATVFEAMALNSQWEELEKGLASANLKPSDHAYFQALLQEAAGEYADAMRAYSALLNEHPDHLQARFRMAFRLDLMGEDGAAIRHYEQLLQLRPTPSSVLINLGIMYEDRNDFEKACGCFGAVLRQDPVNPLARLYFKDAHESLDMYYDEDLERKEDKLMQILRTPISDFELSVRARNCLANMDIRTLGDLVSRTEPELLEFKNFGETSLNEIKRVLSHKGLRLGLRRDDGSFIVPEEFEGGYGGSDLDLEWLGELSEEQVEALDLQISALSLSVRCHRALVERLNLQRTGDVLRYTEEDLLAMPNFGITSLNELQNKLEEFGLRLRKAKEIPEG
ncbi:MAG: tetratricopeptide repeat protein [Planctomycetes bacterium]|nr:tetratricopeptide repeat protein [Planctomycetota bacterium]